MHVAIAQIAPIFLDRDRTVAKVADYVHLAGKDNAQLVCFGESLIPAYPLWLCRTDGARFEADDQKELHAIYLDQSVAISEGHLDPICKAAKDSELAVVLGITERSSDCSNHSLYCSRVIIGPTGDILSVHRKLCPTYEERLVWAQGDGAGLKTHPVGEFTVGALNCWENWMPLARTALYAAGESLHVMIWPGDLRLTRDITRFAAKEGRNYVISASAIIRAQDIPDTIPYREQICGDEQCFYDGGSCIASPTGEWIIEPRVGEEGLYVADLDMHVVLKERQNFDPAGHYNRPDVFDFTVNRKRLKTVEFED